MLTSKKIGNLASVFLLATVIPLPVVADPIDAFSKIAAKEQDAAVTPLINNNDAWFARWRAISHAQKKIDVVYFELNNDVFGRAFLGLLLKQAEKGVKIRLVVDAKQSRFFTGPGRDYLQELANNPNVTIKKYNPLLPSIGRRLSNKGKVVACTHAKILTIDDSLVLTGGRNVGEHYFANEAVDPKALRDSDILLYGKDIVKAYTPAFESDFNHPSAKRVRKDMLGNIISRRDELVGAADAMDLWINKGKLPQQSEEMKQYREDYQAWKERKQRREPHRPITPDMYNDEIRIHRQLANYAISRKPNVEKNSVIKLLYKQSAALNSYKNTITDNLVTLIDSANSEILIQSPYILLSPKIRAALKRAHDKGNVKITIHSNSGESNDSKIQQAFFLAEWQTIQKELPNAKLYLTTRKGLMHSKVFVFDRKVAGVGTYNLDPLSETRNSEVLTIAKSEEVASELAEDIMRDLHRSVLYNPDCDTIGQPDLAKPILDLYLRQSWMRKFL